MKRNTWQTNEEEKTQSLSGSPKFKPVIIIRNDHLHFLNQGFPNYKSMSFLYMISFVSKEWVGRDRNKT